MTSLDHAVQDGSAQTFPSQFCFLFEMTLNSWQRSSKRGKGSLLLLCVFTRSNSDVSLVCFHMESSLCCVNWLIKI